MLCHGKTLGSRKEPREVTRSDNHCQGGTSAGSSPTHYLLCAFRPSAQKHGPTILKETCLYTKFHSNQKKNLPRAQERGTEMTADVVNALGHVGLTFRTLCDTLSKTFICSKEGSPAYIGRARRCLFIPVRPRARACSISEDTTVSTSS